MTIQKVATKIKAGQQPRDISFWKSKSYTQRIEALEQIRSEYNTWRYHAEQGFQRVYRIVKQK